MSTLALGSRLNHTLEQGVARDRLSSPDRPGWSVNKAGELERRWARSIHCAGLQRVLLTNSEAFREPTVIAGSGTAPPC